MVGEDGTPWLIDPAAYGGHREVDLAMLRLFGAPGARCFAAYEEIAPLAAGHEERVVLWQVMPLLDARGAVRRRLWRVGGARRALIYAPRR